jgi:uncharacterized protein YfkK (UPF0435 family)
MSTNTILLLSVFTIATVGIYHQAKYEPYKYDSHAEIIQKYKKKHELSPNEIIEIENEMRKRRLQI